MNTKKSLTVLFPFSRRDLLVTAGILACTVTLCFFIRLAGGLEGFTSPVFVLSVLLISRLTTGYFYGLVSVVLGVVFVNFIFTRPYWAFNLTNPGYPVTFFTLLMVSIITCSLTAQAKEQAHLLAENERVKMRANLLRSVSHDIRTPLTSIVGSTSAILENPGLSQEQQRALLENTREEAQWLIRVVENLLSITRIGDAQAQITKELEAAEEVLGEVVRKFRRRFPRISVSVAVPEEVFLVPMDPILIDQVLSNLMENAAIHGETTCIQLSLKKEDSFARFSVRDDGKGIPSKELPGLFNETKKPHSASHGDGKRNMGLGLSVCSAIVRAHGGTMEAKNYEGGAEFSFRLPMSEEDDYADSGKNPGD